MNITALLFFIYGFAILYLFAYGVAQLYLLYYYRQKGRKTFLKTVSYKKVTIQLPIFNEKYVVERLLDAVSKINYPREFLEIQILDDSTDETSAIILEKIKNFPSLKIEYIHRSDRTGFKAGALANGTKVAFGDFIAIFDADFIPKPNFLLDTLPYFSNEKIGLVQTRWTHINENYSLLTQIQAFALNAHFTVEQGGRNKGGLCINFNGTAGIWRKSCIVDAGGWLFNSITEDLDLSYRAQMKGWRFEFIESIKSPAELPVEMNAIRSQQFRWTKGAAECAKMLIWPLIRNKNLDLAEKIHGCFHLLNSTGYVLMLLIALLCYPVSINAGASPLFVFFASIFQINWLVLIAFYATAYFRLHKKNYFIFTWQFTTFMIFMAGFSLHNSVAVMEGWLGIKTPFIRTPKYNILNNNESWKINQYVQGRLNPIIWLEILLFFYFVWVVYQSVQLGLYGILPFYSMLIIGYGMVIFYSFKHTQQVA